MENDHFLYQCDEKRCDVRQFDVLSALSDSLEWHAANSEPQNYSHRPCAPMCSQGPVPTHTPIENRIVTQSLAVASSVNQRHATYRIHCAHLIPTHYWQNGLLRSQKL